MEPVVANVNHLVWAALSVSGSIAAFFLKRLIDRVSEMSVLVTAQDKTVNELEKKVSSLTEKIESIHKLREEFAGMRMAMRFFFQNYEGNGSADDAKPPWET